MFNKLIKRNGEISRNSRKPKWSLWTICWRKWLEKLEGVITRVSRDPRTPAAVNVFTSEPHLFLLFILSHLENQSTLTKYCSLQSTRCRCNYSACINRVKFFRESREYLTKLWNIRSQSTLSWIELLLLIFVVDAYISNRLFNLDGFIITGF